jgi:hypothetical protein
MKPEKKSDRRPYGDLTQAELETAIEHAATNAERPDTSASYRTYWRLRLAAFKRELSARSPDRAQ